MVQALAFDGGGFRQKSLGKITEIKGTTEAKEQYRLKYNTD